MWDEKTQRFLYTKETKLLLEHSLYTISKWESVYKKRFLDDKVEKTQAETIGYIRMMIQNEEEIDDVTFAYIINTPFIIKEILDYISDSRTATVLPNKNGEEKNDEPVSSELIYYWMFSAQIDISCEHWHISRLLTLLGIFSIKNADPKKEDPKKIQERNRKRHEKLKQERIEKWKREHPGESIGG